MAKSIAHGICQNPEEVIALGVDIILPGSSSVISRLAILSKTGKFASALQDTSKIAAKIATEGKVAHEIAHAANPTQAVLDAGAKAAYAEQKAVARAAKAEQSAAVGLSKGYGSQFTNLTKDQLLKSKASYEMLIVEHEKKLVDYMKNPDKFDNLNLLQNISHEIREKQIGRAHV